MSLNALIIRNAIPVLASREAFLLHNDTVLIEINNKQNNYKGDGKIYLTNYRLIFLKRNPTHIFNSFNVLYSHIRNHKYRKKLFSAPILCGTATPTINGSLNGDDIKWCIKFNDTNSAKTLYNLFQIQLNKINNESHATEYKNIISTHSLTIEQVFPEYNKRLNRTKKNVNKSVNNIWSVSKNKHISISKPVNFFQEYCKQKITYFEGNYNSKHAHHFEEINERCKCLISGFIRNMQELFPTNVSYYHITTLFVHIIALYFHERHKWNNVVPVNSEKYYTHIDPSNPDDIVLNLPIGYV
eukprot:30281_1